MTIKYSPSTDFDKREAVQVCTTTLLTAERPIIINKPEYKFETTLFLPPNSERKAEGGLRTKGFFKHSYKLRISESQGESGGQKMWYICDTDGNPVKPATTDIQQKINAYLNSLTQKDKSCLNPEQAAELPLITVITVVLNGEKYLEQTIQSVISQTYPNVEYVIIDGGSTDGTLDIIRKYEDYIDYWVSESDKGIYDAMNKGVELAFGIYLNMLNSGDKYIDSFVINDLYWIINSYNNYPCAIAGKWIANFGELMTKLYPQPEKIGKDIGWFICHQSLFYLKKIHKEIGLYGLKFKITSDDNFYYSIIKKGYCIEKCNRVFSMFDARNGESKSFSQIFEAYICFQKNFGFRLNVLIKTIRCLLNRIIVSIMEKNEATKKALKFLRGLKHKQIFCSPGKVDQW